jgi:hypothetical protein
MMGLSQIDMVSLVTNEMVGQVTNNDPDALVPGTLQVCGPLVLEGDDASGDAAIFAVVRQDDLVAVGRDTITAGRWGIHVVEPTGQAFQTRPAIASVTISLRKENPPGLETLSWVQPVEIKSPRQAPATGPAPDFAASAVGEPDEGPLTGQSVASSLAIRSNQPAAAAGLTHTWRHQLELLRIPDPTDGSTATGRPVA